MSKKLTIVFLILLIPFTLSHAQSIPLKDYRPINSDEQAVVDLLESLLEGWKNKDKRQILSLCHKRVKFLDSSGKYITLDQMMRTDVSDWGPPGNSLYSYNDVKILTHEYNAAVNLIGKMDDSIFTINMQLIRKGDKWLIIRHEWQP